MTAPKSIVVSIDHRCDLGNSFWQAERVAGKYANIITNTPCTVREDCGATIQPGETAAMWYFTRNADNGITIGWLCEHCDNDLVGQADDVEGGN
jgi:hypothetical protein